MRDRTGVGNVNAADAAHVLDSVDGPDVWDVPDGFDVVDVSKGSGLR